MATTYRIAVIGSWESVMGFRALGLETYPVTAPEEARQVSIRKQPNGMPAAWSM